MHSCSVVWPGPLWTLDLITKWSASPKTNSTFQTAPQSARPAGKRGLWTGLSWRFITSKILSFHTTCCDARFPVSAGSVGPGEARFWPFDVRVSDTNQWRQLGSSGKLICFGFRFLTVDWNVDSFLSRSSNNMSVMNHTAGVSFHHRVSSSLPDSDLPPSLLTFFSHSFSASSASLQILATNPLCFLD